MNHTYRKTGVSVRLERWSDREHSVTIHESGVARVEGRRFECAPAGESPNAPAAPSPRHPRLEMRGYLLEHVSTIFGAAHHSIEGEDGSRRWSDESFAIHASLFDARMRFRASATFGGPDCVLQFEEWTAALEELATLEFRASSPVAELDLPPNVTAQVVALLFAATPGSFHAPPRSKVGFMQRAPEWAELDGCGRKVERREVGAIENGRFARRPASSWFRPSYRFPPRLAPLHVEMKVDAAEAEPGKASARAVSTTSSPQVTGSGLAIELLCRDDSSAFVLPLELTFADWFEAIVRVDDDAVWTPYAGGTWGSTTHLTVS